MINLLPPEYKEQIVYARRNTLLFKRTLISLLGIAGLVALMSFGYIYLDQSSKNINKQIAQTQEQLSAQKVTETQKRVGEISSTLQLVLQVLGKEVLFSKLIQQVGAAIPQGTALTDLKLTKITGGAGIDLQFAASSYQTGTQIQINLEDPTNKIFEKADILSINCNTTATADPRYPCTVTIKAQFAKNNPYLFIGSSSKAGQP